MITAPGVYEMADTDYHADPCASASLSASIAKVLLARSPRHAWIKHPRLNPDYKPDFDGKYDIGTAAHAAVLQGLDVCDALPFDDWRTKAAREARDCARAENRIPLLSKDYATVQDMRTAAVTAIAECADLSGVTLADGDAEKTLAWQEGGIWCRARLDWLSHKRDLIIDYKTTSASANPSAWARTMAGMGGEIQPAFYLRGNAATGGPTRTHWVFLVQETYAPYACSFVGLSPAYLAWAAEKVTEAIRLWTACMSANDWPGYQSRITYLDPPSWGQIEWNVRMSEQQPTENGEPFPWE